MTNLFFCRLVIPRLCYTVNSDSNKNTMLVQSTLDILYLTLAASIAVLTIFLIWGIYYVVRMLRNAVYMTEKVTSVMQKADEVLDLAKDKLHSTGTYLGIAANAVQGAIEYFGDKKTVKRKAKRK